MKSPRQRMTPECRKLYDRICRHMKKVEKEQKVNVNKMVRAMRAELERKGKP